MSIKKFSVVMAFLSIFCSSYTEASIKEFGMGSVGIAYPQDTGVGLINPAGMVAIGNRTDSSAGVWIQSANAKVSGNANDAANGSWNPAKSRGAKYYPAAASGANLMLTPNLAVGISLGSKNLISKTSYKRPFPLSGTTPFGAEYVTAQASPTIAYNYCDTVYVGFSFNIALQRAMTKGFQNIISNSAYPTKVTNRNLDYAWGYGLSFGLMANVTPCVTLGVKYDTIIKNAAFTKYRGFSPTKGRVDLPARFGAGIAYKVSPCMTLAFDAERVYTNQIPTWVNPIYPNVFEHRLGTSSGVGHGFKSFWIYHVGMDYTFCCDYTVRAGYFYSKSPVRRDNTFNNHYTLTPIPEHYLTFGATWNFNPCFDVSIAYMHAIKNTIKGKGSIAPEFGGGELDLSQRMDIILIGGGYNF